jgi:superfamily II DNA/RNA helicase
MIRRGMVDIRKIDVCVLDEADEMLNTGKNASNKLLNYFKRFILKKMNV